MILMQGATDGQKARKNTGKVGKLIGVGQWTRQRLLKKKTKNDWTKRQT